MRITARMVLAWMLALASHASAQPESSPPGQQGDASEAGPPAGAVVIAPGTTVEPVHVTTGVGTAGTDTEQNNDSALALSDVLGSTRSHHPRVRAALENEEIARAELMAARGGFDPQLDVSAKLRTGGYYDLRRLDVELRQPTAVWGTEVYAGYRLGLGVEGDRYPSYYSDETLDGGELRAGVRVPLWQDGPLDKRRAAQAEADLGVAAAKEQRQAVEVALQQSATDAYFGWVAAGRQAQVTSQLLELARVRREFVNARVAAGAIAQVESLEVERSVLKRQASLLKAKRSVERSSLVLSLYSRRADGTPLLPSMQALPKVLPVPERLPQQAPDRAALECNPEVAQKRAKLAQAQVKADLARAQRAPRLDATLEASRDLGQGDATLPGTVFEGGLKFSLPLLMRTPRGRVDAAEGLVRVLEQELRFLQDKLIAAQLDARSAERYAWERYEVATQLLDTVERLAEAERQRFEAGSTSLFVVNQREQALAEAALDQVDAARDLWAARAAYQAATACSTP